MNKENVHSCASSTGRIRN